MKDRYIIFLAIVTLTGLLIGCTAAPSKEESVPVLLDSLKTQGKSRGPPWEITWAPMGNHVGPLGKSRGHPGEITWAPRGNHLLPHAAHPALFHFSFNVFPQNTNKDVWP